MQYRFRNKKFNSRILVPFQAPLKEVLYFLKPVIVRSNVRCGGLHSGLQVLSGRVSWTAGAWSVVAVVVVAVVIVNCCAGVVVVVVVIVGALGFGL